VIGEPKSGLIERRRTFGQVIDLARAIEQRVLGVDVEMRAGGTHRADPSIGVSADIFRFVAPAQEN
jgi:hypothetical protein